MQLYCPSCRRPRPLGMRCPQCDTRLVATAEAHDAVLTGRSTLPPPPAAPGVPGRILAGIVAALGTVLALRDLALGLVGLTMGEESAVAAAPALGMTFATVGAMAGGLLAGAGLSRGAIGGGFAGACVGILLTSAAAHAGDRPPLAWTDLGVAAGLTGVAALAGRVGSRVWPPAPPLPVAQPKTRGSSVARLIEEAAAETPQSPPTRWVKIVCAAAVLLFGVWYADALRTAAATTVAGRVNVGAARAEVASGLIAIGFVAFAGIVAGAVTHSGWRHGLYAGLAGAAGVGLMLMIGNQAVAAPFEGLLAVVGPVRGGRFTLVGALVVVATLGGAFGAALLPVLGKPRARRLFD